jgi:hypothetical protein
MTIFILLGLFGLTPPTLSDVCNSAAAPNGAAELNADCSTTGSLVSTTARVYYSTDGQASWIEFSMSRLTSPGYESTYSRGLVVPGSGDFWYYVRAENGTNAATQSPYNTANAWPQPANLQALATTDPVGDAVDPEGDWLDLTGAYVGYSSDRFYALLTNNSTGWPTYTFPQPWYIYSIGFVNAEAPSDSYAFSMSYASIPGVFSTGLYLINLYTADFTRIADIDAQTDRNKLYLRGRISDLTGHAKFGPWPNPSGFLSVAANTQSIYPLGGSYARDTTATVRYYAGVTPVFTVGQNTPMLLDDPSVEPRDGLPGTEFLFSVAYADADTNVPVGRSLIVDGAEYYLVPSSHRYWERVDFTRRLSGFTPGWHRFQYRFSDGMTTETSPLDSFHVGGAGAAERPGLPPSRFSITPAISRGRFHLLAPGGTQVDVGDALGQVVRTSTADELDLSSLGPGVYFARLRSGSETRLFRLTVAR